ncbi:GIN domain-containing protein [Parvularcula sp. IMCC14364]|uniref:GIN domain-containing protein n=1 Tax=Parvularcula sp. IMCC14364 TaxID=3067902 RepID=UPI0027429051|nr:DUF2807 domain-containing protein [Parvularcula sp. IMCC14364]
MLQSARIYVTPLHLKASSLLAGLTLLLVSAISPAASATETFTGSDRIVLEDFIATVSIMTGDGADISVTIDNGSADKEPVQAEQNGNAVRLYSNEKPDQRTFWRKMDWQRHGKDAFKVFLEDYPVIQITVPEGTDLSLAGAAVHLTVGNINGDVQIGNTLYVQGTVGNVKAADIRITGGGDLIFASVAEDLEARIAGSGSLAFNNVQSADLSIAGSGDIDVKKIAGNFRADIRGSGDIITGDIEGESIFQIAGSGDIEAGNVNGGADISIRGSGDIVINELNGPSEIGITGNGDVDIRRGRAEDLRVRISGSGDFKFNGLATNPDVSISGSGDVFIREYEGSVRTSGSGDIIIGDIRIDD